MEILVNTLHDVLDKYTKEAVSYDKVTLFHDGTSMNDSKVDQIIYKKYLGEYYKRNVIGELNVLWFGADPTFTTNCIAAFNAAVVMANALKLNIFIPKGKYKLGNSWIIPGRSTASSILVRGEGARNTILDFTTSTDTICIQYGTPNSNALHGGMSDFQITGTQTAHGLVISSHAPYAAAFNTFSNIYMFRVNDGITFDGLSSNTSSNFQNFFYNMMVEEYWGRGIYCDGAMNVFDGGFIVAPYGNHGVPVSGSGANSLAVYEYGGGNTYNNIPTEDQWVLNGSNTKVTRCTIELIQKSVVSSVAGSSAIVIAGSGVSVDGFTITQIPNSFINQMMAIYGPNINLKNIVYLNPGNVAEYIITYPILPNPSSSGIMENISVSTIYGINHPALYDASSKWTFINILGNNDVNFSRIVDLEFPNAPDISNLLDKTVGGTVSGYTTFGDLKINNSLELHGFVYDLSAGHVFGNKAGGGYLSFITRDATGSEAVINLSNIGSIIASGKISAAAGTSSGDVVNKGQLDAAISSIDASNLVKLTGGYQSVSAYTAFSDIKVTGTTELHGTIYDLTSGTLMQNKAGDGYVPTFARDITGSEVVLNIDHVGTINSSGNSTIFGGAIVCNSINVNSGAGTQPTSKLIANGVDGNNGGVTIQYKEAGTYKDGIVLDRFGILTTGSIVGVTESTSENSTKLASTKWVREYGVLSAGKFAQIDSPSAPTIAINETSGNLTGTYIYQVTFYTAQGETEGGANTGPITISGLQVDLTNIPISSDPTVIGRKIYRSGVYTDTVVKQLVTTIANNTTTTFTDNVADGSLGVYIPRVNTTGGQLFVNNNRIGAADSSSTLFGRNTMPLNQGYANSAFGLNVLTNNTYGYRNTGMGVNALYNNTTGYENSGFGVHALDNTTTGISNTAIGYAAMISNTTGSDNTAIGKSAAGSSLTSSRITSVGSLSLHLNTTGQNLCAFGNDTLQANTTGQNNSGFGESALHANQTGHFNTAMGSGSAYLATGNSNTAIGFQSLFNSTGGGNTCLGTFAGYYETGSNKLYIDNTTRADEADARLKALIYGVFDPSITNQVIRLNGTLQVGNVLEYADNAAAVTGGLVIGTIYRTGDTLKIVHS